MRVTSGGFSHSHLSRTWIFTAFTFSSLFFLIEAFIASPSLLPFLFTCLLSSNAHQLFDLCFDRYLREKKNTFVMLCAPNETHDAMFRVRRRNEKILKTLLRLVVTQSSIAFCALYRCRYINIYIYIDNTSLYYNISLLYFLRCTSIHLVLINI